MVASEPGSADADPRHPLACVVGKTDSAGYIYQLGVSTALPPTTTSPLGRHSHSRSAMQSMSSGLRTQAGRALHRPPGSASRSLHTPSWIPRAPPRSSGSSAATFFRQARTFVTRIVSELTAPGAFNHVPHAPGPSYSTNPFRFQTIQQRLNGPTRLTLSRPLGAPCLPRGPVVPRNVTQVGLGTARNFSSARPLFQNLAENVPIAGRALWEADWDIKIQKERELMKPKKFTPSKENKRTNRQVLQPLRNEVPVTTAPVESITQADLDHYFPSPVVPQVTTYLLIPLAPTPTSRLPLAISPSIHTSNHPLIPFSYLSSIHADHATHTLRVSSLFARLDTARVFEAPEVSCSAYGHASGLCTVLEVKFVGWAEAQVRGVLGEAGTGWCVLEEVHENEAAAMDDALSEMSFDTSTPPRMGHADIDPSASFVLPTLDFSASFVAERESWARPSSPSRAPSPLSASTSDLEFHNAWLSANGGSDEGSDMDAFSDISESPSLGSVSGWGSSPSPFPSRPPSADGWTPLGFSSTFANSMSRSDVDVHEGPREAMF